MRKGRQLADEEQAASDPLRVARQKVSLDELTAGGALWWLPVRREPDPLARGRRATRLLTVYQQRSAELARLSKEAVDAARLLAADPLLGDSCIAYRSLP